MSCPVPPVGYSFVFTLFFQAPYSEPTLNQITVLLDNKNA